MMRICDLGSICLWGTERTWLESHRFNGQQLGALEPGA